MGHPGIGRGLIQGGMHEGFAALLARPSANIASVLLSLQPRIIGDILCSMNSTL